jgi:hypothetical protein
MSMKRQSYWEQQDLFSPIPNRPQWHQIPERERDDIVRLLAEILQQSIQGKKVGSPMSVENSHE